MIFLMHGSYATINIINTTIVAWFYFVLGAQAYWTNIDWHTPYSYVYEYHFLITKFLMPYLS